MHTVRKQQQRTFPMWCKQIAENITNVVEAALWNSAQAGKAVALKSVRGNSSREHYMCIAAQEHRTAARESRFFCPVHQKARRAIKIRSRKICVCSLSNIVDSFGKLQPKRHKAKPRRATKLGSRTFFFGSGKKRDVFCVDS